MTPSQPLEKVAIVGATGHIGRVFVDALVKNGRHEITALTRDLRQAILPDSIKRVQVNFDDADSIVAALAGIEFLIITLPVTAGRNVHSNIVNAAAMAGVSYVVPSFYGSDIRNPKLGEEHFGAVIERQLAEMEHLGISYISLACGTWYEWSLALGEPWFGFNIPKREVTFFDDGETKIHVSTWPQCGRAIVALLNLPESNASPCLADWKNEPAYITSFSVSQRDMLDSLHRVLGTSDVDWKITFESTTKRAGDGMAEVAKGVITGFGKAMYAKLFMRSRAGELDVPREMDNKRLELPVESLDEATRTAVEMVKSGWNPFAK